MDALDVTARTCVVISLATLAADINCRLDCLPKASCRKRYPLTNWRDVCERIKIDEKLQEKLVRNPKASFVPIVVLGDGRVPGMKLTVQKDSDL